MATPTGGTYSGAGAIFGGRVDPNRVPLWAKNAELFKPVVIPVKNVPYGDVFEYGGWGARQDILELVGMRNGGHERASNLVESMSLLADEPEWTLRTPSTPSAQMTACVLYEPDGKPVSVHTYSSTYWVPSVGRWIQAGERGTFCPTSTDNSGNINGWDPVTNTWDPAGTWPTFPIKTMSNAFDPVREQFWTFNWHRFAPKTKTIDQPISVRPVLVRGTVAYEPVSDRMFSLSWGDGHGGSLNLGMQASAWSAGGSGSQVAITFNASAAYDQFLADAAIKPPMYSALTYDSLNQCFYWSDNRSVAGRVYKITPNAGTSWDMEIVQWASGSWVDNGGSCPMTPDAGLNQRMHYFSRLKGFIFCPVIQNPSRTGKMYFVRTSQ